MSKGFCSEVTGNFCQSSSNGAKGMEAWLDWNHTRVGRWESRDTLQKDCQWKEYEERIGNWKGKSFCKWAYQNVNFPNSEMEQEAVVMRQKTVDGRREGYRALLKRSMWAWGVHIPLS